MRLLAVMLFATAALGLSGCAVLSSQPTPARWTTGFWFWRGSRVDPSYSGKTLDIVYVQAGTIRQTTVPPYARPGDNLPADWIVYGSLPSKLPPARGYWLVYRYENQGVPDLGAAPRLVEDIAELQAEAQDRHLSVAGIQLDIDSPTSALPRYADFLREFRKGLPKELQVSITTLLDWFRNGTGIREVIAQVDEFVAQFYDIGDPAADGEAAIAARIDSAHWGPVFNRFGKRFRIGISSFGRARVVPHQAPARSPYRRLVFYGDLRPLDVATNPAFQLQTARNAANETVLSYRAIRKVKVEYERLDAGDIVQFIISTPNAIQAAVQSARQMKGYLTGVVFFRWPSSREDWAMQPDEVLDAANLGAPGQRTEVGVQAISGDCAAVSCVDVYLESAGPLSPRPVQYRVRASTPLEYFLPERNMPVHLAGASELEVRLPAFCGRGHLYIGRAVSLQPTGFTVEEER